MCCNIQVCENAVLTMFSPQFVMKKIFWEDVDFVPIAIQYCNMKQEWCVT